jgi:hypothetical protein
VRIDVMVLIYLIDDDDIKNAKYGFWYVICKKNYKGGWIWRDFY